MTAPTPPLGGYSRFRLKKLHLSCPDVRRELEQVNLPAFYEPDGSGGFVLGASPPSTAEAVDKVVHSLVDYFRPLMGTRIGTSLEITSEEFSSATGGSGSERLADATFEQLSECTAVEFWGFSAEGGCERLSVWQPVGLLAEPSNDVTPELRDLQNEYRRLLGQYQGDELPRRPTLEGFAEHRFMSKSALKRFLRGIGADWRRDFGSLAPLPEAEDDPLL